MSFDISVFGTAIPTDATFYKSFRADLNLAFGLDRVLSAFLDGPLSGVPPGACTSGLSYNSPNIPLLPASAPVNFSLAAGVSGLFEIVLSGDLVPYTDGLDNPKQTSFPVPPHTAYTRVTLNFSISVQVAGNASFSGGAYGVKGSASSADTYAVTFCKAFDPSTTVKTAIARTIQGFVLPLNDNTMTLLESGDYLLHEFDGSLNLSFGAFAGIDKVLYSGQSTADVLAVKGSSIATLATQVKPEIKFDTELDFAFQFATRFEALVSRIGNTGKLHLFRSRKAVAATTLSAGLEFSANASAKLDASAQALANSVGAGSSAVSIVANAAQGEISKGVTELNNTLSQWLSRANGVKANLQVTIENINARTILAAYDFDLSLVADPSFKDAWTSAIKGDMVKALQSRTAAGAGIVTLEIGSGLESEYQRKTSFTCNFSNLWHFSSWNQWSSQASMVYAGNNVFHMVANIGRKTETDYVGAMKSINFYFAASANQVFGGEGSKPMADLHIDLTAQGRPKAARQIAGMLSGIGGSQDCIAMARRMNAFIDASPGGAVQLNITIPPTAYGLIAADPVSNSPTPANTLHDRKNWEYYVNAADALDAWQLRVLPGVSDQALSFITSYAGWEDFSKAMNDRPNRNETISPNVWPQDLLAIDDRNLRTLIAYSVLSGQHFMNLCDALQQLALIVNVADTEGNWNKLVAFLSDATKLQYVPDFARPVALALIWLCGSGIKYLSGPSDANSASGKFQVQLSM